MELFTHEDLQSLLADHPGPCVSIFVPTQPGGRKEDVIRWRNSLTAVRDRLEQQAMEDTEIKSLLRPAHRLLEDEDFWHNASEGLAFFLAPNFQRYYRLPQRFDELVDVSSRFQVKPLLPLLTSSGRFYVLAFSQNGVRLLQGGNHSLREIDLTKVKGMPASLADTLKYDEKIESLTFHTRPVESPRIWGVIFSGHGVGIDDHKSDLLRYFEEIDHGLHTILKEEKAPLVLASVDYLWPIYRQANSYAHLMEHGIPGNPARLSIRELHDRAWHIVQPVLTRTQEDALALYRQLAGTGRTVDNLAEIIKAAHRGELETLFVAQDRPCWGKFDAASAEIALHPERQPGDEDLLNFAIARTLVHGRPVHALPDNRMPDGRVAAAIYRLPLAKRGRHS